MRELEVRLSFARDDIRTVGILAEDGPRIWFERDASWTGPSLSPYTWRLDEPALREHRPKPGVPIPGVFNDSRPDGWGLKLLHRRFQAAGRPARSVSPLEELAFLGRNTMGALTYHPAAGPSGALDDAISLSELARHAQQVYDNAVEQVLPDLVRAAASSGGARPKALIGLRADGGPGVRFGEAELPVGWDAWMVKFPTSSDDDEVGRRELAWMRLAERAGLQVPACRTLALEGIGDAYAVRRFDRPGEARRVHMLSAAGALDADFRTTFADYRDLLRLTSLVCEGDQRQVLALYRLAVFNVAALNEDDHLKNFAFCLDPDGWRLAPAFDLTYAPHPSGERTTTVLGVGREVSREDVLALADAVGIPSRSAVDVVDEVVAATETVGEVLAAQRCTNAVSRSAASAVLEATTRLRS